MRIDGTAGVYRVAKRFWALAAYGRFIRPGAVRIDASSPNPDLKVSAFRNRDGSRVIEVINTGTRPVTWHGVPRGATAYLTDSTHDLAPSKITGGSVTLQPRALTTIVAGGHR
jgi:hypothetical protein